MASVEKDSRVTNTMVCQCKEGKLCAFCSAASSSDFANVMKELLTQINSLNNQVTDLSKCVRGQHNRLHKLESNGVEGSESSVESSGDKSCDQTVQPIKAKSLGKNKKAFRNKKVTKRKMKDRRMEKEPVPEKGLGLSALNNRSKHNRKQRYFSSEARSSAEQLSSENSSVSSGSDSEVEKKCKRRRRVKSGAEVKQRPVVRTELWPHTISNEDDGENFTSEDISLTKFLTCFTLIITTTTCEIEAAGRALLLHAVSTVLEYLPWAEARSFHNLVMLKVEQDKINWSSDFSALADQFLVKKVRMNLRATASPAGNRSYNAYESNSCCKGHGNTSHLSNYNSNSRGNNINSSYNQSLYSFLCKQWNDGECSYGANCRRWHTCWSCAELGKLGEPHKAVSHYYSAARNRHYNQRV